MTEDNHLLDENLKRMFRSAFDPRNPTFQERLVRDVLGEVARQRRNETSQTWWQGLLSARLWWRPLPLAASAVVVLIALAIWVMVATSIGTVGFR